MNQEKQPLSDAQKSAEILRSINPHSEYKPVIGIPIPAQNGILVKHMPKSSIIETDISLGDEGKNLILSTGNNTRNTCEGIIVSVGPNCSPAVRNGLKIQYATSVHDTAPRFNHKGKDYLGMDEYSILFYMVDESTTVDMGVKDERQVRREKKTALQAQTIKNVYNDDQRKKDIANDKTKGKVHAITKK